MNRKVNILLAFIFVYGALCFISLNRHSHAKIHTYHSEIWADKAGYNVYLPATFIYHFQTESLPKHIDSLTGYGFTIDSTNQKIITKYPYGVALMQSPFWLIAHLLSTEKDGFSVLYQKSIDFAGSFYLCLGIFMLFFLIKQYSTRNYAILLSILLTTSTGIFYYGIFETGMSHIYSFCVLSALVYLLFQTKTQATFYNLLFLGLLSSLYIIIRPINIVFLIVLFAFVLFHNKSAILNFNTFKQLKTIHYIIIISICLILIIPQLAYYKYAFNSYLTNSYSNESFVKPTLRRITQLLFSPHNGLFIYYPIGIFLLIYAFIQQHYSRFLLLSLACVYVILYSSWWSLSLGCGFGHRAFNDIAILFFIPLFMNTPSLKKSVILIIGILAFINLKFIFSYDGCLFSSENGSFTEYFHILFGEFK